MISHQKKFIFVHIPKTAGNSISEYLKEYSADEPFYINGNDIQFKGELDGKNVKHRSINWYYTNYGEKVFYEYFKFAVVRNPFDRIMSRYFWEFEKYDKGRLKWLIESHPEFNTQYHQIGNNMDFLIKFENLNEDFKKVCKKLDIEPPKNLGKFNSSKNNKNISGSISELVKKIESAQERGFFNLKEASILYKAKNEVYDVFLDNKDYKNYFDKEIIDIIKNKFSDDFEKLGYESLK